MWKQAFMLGVLLWAVDAANNTKYIYKEEQSYNEEYLEDEYVSDEENKPGMPIGQWWKNGKALEPKWRDGDNVPLVPFHAITSNKHHSNEHKESDVENVSSFENRDEKIKKLYFDNINNDFTNSDVHLSRRRKPPQLPEEEMDKFEEKQSVTEEDVLFYKKKNPQKFDSPFDFKMQMQDLINNRTNFRPNQNPNHYIKEVKLPYDNQEATIKYRETFQNQPNEYELNDEENQRPRPRKRRPPQNDEFSETKVNYPFYQTIKPVPIIEPKSSNNADLKILLKKQQGNSLSLSEILQRSNLTLSDLLQGKVNIIDLLKTVNKDNEYDEIKSNQDISHEQNQITIRGPFTYVGKETLQYKIIKPEASFDNNQTHIIETKTDESQQIIPLKEVELKDQEIIKSINQNKIKMQESARIINSKIMMSHKMAISENPVRVFTTVRDIDKNTPVSINLSNSDKLVNKEEDEIMEFSDFNSHGSTEEAKYIETTTSIEHTLNTENRNERKEINLEEFTTKTSDIQVITEAGLQKEKITTIKLPVDNLKNINNQNNYSEFISKIEPDTRAEILELFSSGSSAKRLERLLKSRNMTLDEFIALRQRGSSQVHLAEVSKQRRQKSYTVETPLNQDYFNKKTSKSPESSTYVTSSTIRITETTPVEDIKDSVPEEQRVSIQESKIPYTQTVPNVDEPREILDIYTAFDTIPFGQNINLSPSNKNSSMTFIEVGRVEEILEEEPLNDIYKAGGSNTEENPALFSKVMSNIIASGAILGVTIIVFVIIFIICRIQQKQKYTYRNTFSRAVFQSPTLAARKLSNSSSLNTIMVNVVTSSNTKKPERPRDINSDYDKSDIENDSLDGNDSWDTIPDFMN